jgi:serine/threonine protein kinase
MSPQRQPAAPPDLPGHRYVRILGSGGFADVFLYERELPRMPVAVKVLVGGVLTQEDEQRFTTEANTMARFSAHPYIVGIQNAEVSTDGRPYIVMQYYPKDNLAIRCRRSPMTVADVLQIGIQVASAVETAHRAGILHRDIKPANILTGEFGEPGLTDFGIAAATTGATPGGQNTEGLSIPWSPPEAFDSDAGLDERSDVYSLGATVYNLLTGRSPFERIGQSNSALDLMERIERSPVPPIERGDIPLSLSRVLTQAMAKQPDQRHASALAFARDLQAVEQELHLKMTTVIVPNETIDEPVGDPDRGPDETRGRMPVRIDAQSPTGLEEPTRKPPATGPAAPQPSGLAPSGPLIIGGPPTSGGGVESPGVGVRRGLNASGASSPSTVDGMTGTRKRVTVPTTPPAQAVPEDEVPERRSRNATLIGAAIVVVVVAVVGVSVALGSSKGTPQAGTTTTSAPPGLVNGVVPVPTGVKAAVSEGTATLTWTNPSPQSGDTYTVTLQSGPQSGNAQPANSQESFTLPGWNPSVQFCATVRLNRANGQSSDDSAPACAS